MNIYIRKLSTLLILAVFFGRVMLFVPIFIWKKNAIRQAIQEMSSQSSAEKYVSDIFELSPTEYINMNWIKQKKEFRINGEMYDVLKTKIINNKVLIYCYADKKEQQLYVKLKKYFNYSKTKDTKNIYTGMNDIFKYQILFLQDMPCSLQYPFLSESIMLPKAILLQSVFLPDIDRPPPRSVC